MRLKGLMRPLEESSNFSEVIGCLQNGQLPINLSGLSDSGKS